MKTNEFYNDDEFILGEHELLYESVINHYGLNKDAYRHIREGFSRRLTMLECSRLFLREHTDRESANPPDPYLISEMNVHLNSYYTHLRGCLDNLAWALNYHFALVTGTETDASTRRKIDLFGKPFLAALETQRPNLRDSLRQYESWASDLKELRDPVAHRVPLSVISGVLPAERLPEFENLSAQAALPDSERNGRSRSHFMRQAHNLAEYVPLMVLSNVSGLETREIAAQIGSDHRQFLAIAKLIFADFREAAS
ncbi:MAG TPA: hypothetical protein VLB68_11625 [Pyrinomonadaceae bacterium]|nr:hypothetical protein [Pyrinomonadaceae bacterium]